MAVGLLAYYLQAVEVNVCAYVLQTLCEAYRDREGVYMEEERGKEGEKEVERRDDEENARWNGFICGPYYFGFVSVD